MKTSLFIDLEETMIDSCDTCALLPDNLERIKGFISEVNPDTIETFSWGLWSEQDKANWERTKPLVAEGWGFDIKTQTFDIEEQQLAFLRANIGWVKPSEVIDFGGLLKKETVFEWFVRRNFKEGHFILIDDMVPNKRIDFDGKLIITFININGAKI